jgi:molecular chaperone GrpE
MGKNKENKDQVEDMEHNENPAEEQPVDPTVETEESTDSSEETVEAAEEVEIPKIKTPEELVAEMNDKYLRLYSEFDNYRKRSNREKIDIIKNASGDVLKELLSVLDDFHRAEKANAESDDSEALKEGFKLIQNKLFSILERKGLKAMDSIGKEFNVDHHEAITDIPAPSEDMKGKVVDAIESGYFLNDRVLRFAKVVVGK